MPPVLETARLVFRRFEPGDLDALAALYADPEIRRFFPEGILTRAETHEEVTFFLNGHPKNQDLGLWAAIERETGAFVGRCGLLPWTIDGVEEVEVAFLIAKDRWGEGLATEAARGLVTYAHERLGLARLICLIMYGNEASVRVAEKAGFRFEREHTDEYGPCMIYAR
ncbi:MAG TPA: GNAT family N-acetyltransferase [Actinomycetota bacterium]|nr:GNAT family N-acetyltransferase [Actinomycetota bacterium]